MKLTKLTYPELLELSDGALAEEGFRRNENGGITRIKVGDKGKTTGAWGFLKGVLGRKTRKEIQEARLKICEACMAQDSKEERLYRDIGGKKYCGLPRLSQIIRNEQIDGCGCELSYKTSRINASCPLNRWLEAKTISALNITSSQKSKGCGCGSPKQEN
jgi:hypothetical protein